MNKEGEANIPSDRTRDGRTARERKNEKEGRENDRRRKGRFVPPRSERR